MSNAVAEPIIKRTQVIVDAPKPAVEPPKVKLPETEAELEARRANVMQAMWGPKPAPKPAEEPVAPAAADPADGAPPADPATPAAAATPTADAAPVAAAAPAATPPVDAQALITATAKQIGEQVGRAIEGAKPASPPPIEPAPEPELTPEDLRDAEIIAKMEELDPTLKGRADEFKTFARRRYDYEAAWRQKNPGATFNPDDADHEEFYKGQPEIDEDLYAKAERKLEVAKEVAEVVKPIKEKQEAEQRRTKSEQAIAAAAPKIAAALSGKIMEVVGNVSADVAALLKDMNPLALKPEEITKLEDADPIVARVMGPMVMNEMVPMLAELEKSVAPGADYVLDPRTNPIHAGIVKYLDKFEQEQAAKPVARAGREFITLAEFGTKQQQIVNGRGTDAEKSRKLDELGGRYWTATVDDIQKTIVDDISTRAKAEVEALDGLARRKYKPDAKPTAAKTAAAAPATTTQQTPAPNGKPKPPVVASQATVVDTSRAGQPNGKSFGEIAVETHWGR